MEPSTSTRTLILKTKPANRRWPPRRRIGSTALYWRISGSTNSIRPQPHLQLGHVDGGWAKDWFCWGRHGNVAVASLYQTDECCSVCLIDGKGTFNISGIKAFEKKVKLDVSGLSYTTLSIMGPQSSGKSTLLNHLFGTNFREMDALNERGQTTQGIWWAKCPGVEPCTLVMDLEGSDGRERGEDDTAFEKQAALFAFSVSDIVLINMWCHDVGRVQAANQPLLRIVFEVMGKLFSYRKITLWIVLRDKTRTPTGILERLLWKDLQQIWDSLDNPQADKGTPLNEIFNVKITALISFEDTEDQFKEEVIELRQQLLNPIMHGGFDGDGRRVVPASGFSVSVQEIWEKIKESKDLSIPAQRIMEATVLCEDIAKEKHASFVANEYWCQLEKDVQSCLVLDFGKKINPILKSYLSEYDLEAKYFDEVVRTEKRKQLKEKLLQVVKPAWQSMLEHVYSDTLNKFKEAFNEKLKGGGEFSADARDCANSFMTQFDEECQVAIVKLASWDSSKFCEKLQKDIDAHVAVVRMSMLSELVTQHEKNLKAALSGPVESLLVRAGDDMWKEIRKLFRHEIESCLTKFSTALSGFEEDEQTKNKRLKELKDYAKGLIHTKAKQEAGRVLMNMKDRFERFFIHDSDSNMRIWNGEENIPAIRQTARAASLKLLSIMAAIRLDEDPDDIKKTRFRALAGSNAVLKLSVPLASDTRGKIKISEDSDDIEKTLFRALGDSNWSSKLSVSLDSDTWEKVPRSNTLITPTESKDIWRKFNEFSEPLVMKAQVIVDTIRCAAIASNKLASFIENKDWCNLEKDLLLHPVPDFGKRLSLIIDTCLSAYDVETRSSDEGVKSEKRSQLKDKLLQQASQSMFEHICSRTLNKFKGAFSEKLKGGEPFSVAAHDSKKSSIAQFDKECTVDAIENANWESSTFRDKLQQDIELHVAEARSSMQSILSTQFEEKLKSLLVRAGNDTWQEKGKLHAIQSCFNDFSAALSNSGEDEQTKHKMLKDLEDYARRVIQAKARQEAVTVLIHVKDMFQCFFSHDSNLKLRGWYGKEDVLESASSKLHSVLAVIRVDDDANDIDKTLCYAWMENDVSTKLSDQLARGPWGRVSFTNTSINRVEIKDFLRQFNEYSEPIVIQNQVKVATVRCEAITCKKLVSFIANENWCQLKKDVHFHPVPDFGKKLNLIVHTCLSEYDTETVYFDEGVSTEKRRQLRDGLLLLVRPTCESMLEHVYAGTLQKFKHALDEKLGGGEEFRVAADDCTKTFMTQYDEGCKGVVSNFTMAFSSMGAFDCKVGKTWKVAIIDGEKWDSSELRNKLQREFDLLSALRNPNKWQAPLAADRIYR